LDHSVDGELGRRIELTSDPVSLQTNLPTFAKPQTKVRRRFQDFVFLHNNLVKDFPACIVPPLPDKHRLGQSPHPVRLAASRHKPIELTSSSSSPLRVPSRT
jgi:hypothetical protein